MDFNNDADGSIPTDESLKKTMQKSSLIDLESLNFGSAIEKISAQEQPETSHLSERLL
jgi:hypothetical protein